ncbi:trigger factor [Amnimonas aquatica]|uniref:Trigger factor n=1 Tax=Amnimonas aquatica TaxID=2094561 RepID=A0A2P6AUT4_9GAMM|nr:trigger factor [Amnimonas aquatica]PQA51041.1 trigger factor [Amnimonas aquatica]
MQVTVETVSNLERRVKVVVPAAKIDQDVSARVAKAARTIRMDGFRPGKVPLSLVQKRFGESIRQEALGEIIRDSFYEAVTQEKLNPAGFPSIEEVTDKAGEDLAFTALVEVYPELALAGFGDIKVERPVVEISDADIDEMIENLRKQRATFEDSSDAAADGDKVTLDFAGTIDGEAFEGGTSQNFDLVLGSNRMIPGFETGIVGIKAGEERDINVTFPSDYQAEHLRDKAAVFKITAHKVSKQVLPAVDEAFLSAFGVKDGGLEKFREDVRKNMTRELKQAVKNKVKTQIMDALLAGNTVEAPKALVANEINRQRQAMFQQFGGGAKLDPKMLPDELFAEQAQRSVSLGLLISQIIKDKALEVDQERVRVLVEEVAESYETPEDVVNYYYGNREQLAQVEALVLEDQVVDAVLGEAQVTDQAAKYVDVVRSTAR